MRVDANLMLMPKASPHFDYLAQPGKHEVWLARKSRYVQSVSKTHSMNKPPHSHLGRCVFRPNLAHVLRTASWSQTVCHTARSRGRSAMSFSLLPRTIIFNASSESANPNSS